MKLCAPGNTNCLLANSAIVKNIATAVMLNVIFLNLLIGPTIMHYLAELYNERFLAGSWSYQDEEEPEDLEPPPLGA